MKNLLLALIPALFIGFTGCASTPSRTAYRYGDAPPAYSQSQSVYSPPPSAQDEANKKIIKQGLMGAAVGAISAETSGGKAGTGALVGAGTNVLGGALFDMLTAPQNQPPPPQQVQYVPYVNQWNQENPNTRIVRKYDSNGNVVSEEVFTR